MKHFNLSAKELASTSGITESALSKFRNGERDLMQSSVEKLLQALPDDAFHYLLSQLASDRMSPQHAIQMLNVLADKLESGELRLKPSFNSFLGVS
jgi:transcriptional regulator with XRE-family HTH domain